MLSIYTGHFMATQGPFRSSGKTPAAAATLTREAWLQAAAQELAGLFQLIGHAVPPVKASVGFASGGLRSNAIGQCWPRKGAKDNLNHIFIAPSLGTAFEAIDTLAHELIHAVDDCEHKHGKEFKAIALALGMKGPMRSAAAGEKLKPKLEAILKTLPPYPHGKLNAPPMRIRSNPPPKACCEICGYKVTVPKRFLHFGPPLCPTHKVPMTGIGEWPE